MGIFDVFFDVGLHKLLNKLSTTWHSYDVTVMQQPFLTCAFWLTRHVAQVAINRTTIRVPYIHVKSLQIILFQWRQNEHKSVSNKKHIDCLLSRLFRRTSKKASKLRATNLCEWNPPMTGRLLSWRASDVENASNWWCYYAKIEHRQI